MQKMNFCGYKEVVFSSDDNNDKGIISCWDPATGEILYTFRSGSSSSRALACVNSDYFLSAVINKPIINVFPCCKIKGSSMRQMIIPGEITAMTATPRGHYCVAAICKKLYVWEVATGDLMSVVEYHKQDVSCIKFTDDGFLLVTAGKDALVAVWKFAEVLRQRKSAVNMQIKPMYSWTDHSTVVEDIYIGFGGIKAKVATASLDETCRIYSLASGKLMFSIYTNVPLFSVVMDSAEYFLSLGTESGKILRIEWYKCLQETDLNVLEDSEDAFVGHSDAVTCLASSIDGKLLLSGSKDKTAKVWDTLSFTCTFTFKHDGSVTNAFFMMAPSCFQNGECSVPRLEVKPFSKTPITHNENPISMKLEERAPSSLSLQSSGDFNRIAFKGLISTRAKNKAELQAGFNKARRANHHLYSFSMNSMLDDEGNSMFRQ